MAVVLENKKEVDMTIQRYKVTTNPIRGTKLRKAKHGDLVKYVTHKKVADELEFAMAEVDRLKVENHGLRCCGNCCKYVYSIVGSTQICITTEKAMPGCGYCDKWDRRRPRKESDGEPKDVAIAIPKRRVLKEGKESAGGLKPPPGPDEVRPPPPGPQPRDWKPKYPDYVRVGGTTMRKQNLIEKDTVDYWRDNGAWGVSAKYNDSGVLVTIRSNPVACDHLAGIIVHETTREDWARENQLHSSGRRQGADG